MTKDNPLEKEALEFVFDLFKKKLSDQYVYHDYNHTVETLENAKEISAHYSLSDKDQEILNLACIFHDTGHIESYKNHEDRSAEIAEKYLKEKELDADTIQQVKSVILSTQPDHPSKTFLEEIIHDADILNIGKKSFFRKGKLLRIEWENFLNKNYSDTEWEALQYDFLLNKNFLTEYAQDKYSKQRKKNIDKQRGKLIQEEEVDVKKKNIKSAGRGVETMYRATYRNHINLSSIADNKANMMISINTIIMSVIITIVGSGYTFSGSAFIEHLRFSVPIVILLLTCLTSVIFAVLSARPKVTTHKSQTESENGDKNTHQDRTSMLFFGNYTLLPLEEYIEQMNQLMQNSQRLYDNMSIDIYYLGKVLTKKYNLLRLSYNIFMAGLIVSVLTFVSIFIYTYYKP